MAFKYSEYVLWPLLTSLSISEHKLNCSFYIIYILNGYFTNLLALDILVHNFSKFNSHNICLMAINMHGSGFDCNYFGNGY